MRIKRLYLGDFGIFQNQTMNQIDNGLIVIGGLNRAGKTTLMAALRFLAYGIPKGGAIPPAVRQHEIRADVESGGYAYSIFVNGHGKPSVAAKEQAPEISIEDLYNNLDRFTYNQIFTISLDELRQVPDNMESGDEGRIGAVLLGAGWSDALRLIQLKDSLNKKASDIGGKNGSINTKKFQPHYDKLCAALELRDRANAQMDTYEAKCSRLEEVSVAFLPSVKQNIEAAKKELQRLELIRDRHAKYQAYKINKRVLEEQENRRLLEAYPPAGMEQAHSLKEQYEAAISNEKAARDSFSLLTGCDAGSALQVKLLAAGAALDAHVSRVSGWEARIEAVHSSREELQRNKIELGTDLQELYGSRAEAGDFSFLNTVKADQLNEQQLQYTVSHYNDLQSELKQKDRDLADLDEELAQKTSYVKNLPPADGTLVRKVGWLVGGNVLATVGLSFFLLAGVAITVGIVGAAYILAYFLRQNSILQAKARQLADLEKDISDRQTKKQALTTRHVQVNAELVQISNSITRMKEDYNIPTVVDVPFLPEFVRRVRGLQRVNSQICVKETKLAEMEQELEKELAPLLSTLQSLALPGLEYEDVMREAAMIFRQLERSITYANAARELQRAVNDKAAVGDKIIKLLEEEDASGQPPLAGEALLLQLDAFIGRGQKYAELKKIGQQNDTLRLVLTSDLDTQRWRLLLLGTSDKDDAVADALLSAFASWCEAFTSAEEIKEKHRDLEAEIISLEGELQQLREEKRDLMKAVDELGSDSNLLEAKSQIDEAKSELSRILENFAVHRIAAHMLERVQERLLEKTRDSLLAPASGIFSEITGNSYSHIELPPDNKGAAFIARLSNGKGQAIDTLSRATREQLFFSMRLSRIRDIKPELPVILDDTFANYDPVHTREAVEYLTVLAQTHQIFVLTCHPELLACLQACVDSAACQFWGLEKGRISGPFSSTSEINSLLMRG